MTTKEERATVRLVSLVRELGVILHDYPRLWPVMDALLQHPRVSARRTVGNAPAVGLDSPPVERQPRQTKGWTPAKRKAAAKRAKAMWVKRRKE
jgi:hypothetical protein